MWHVPTYSCSQCLQTDNACGWCIYNKVCSGTPALCTSETNWFQVSNIRVRNYVSHNITASCHSYILFYTQLSTTTYLDVCPLLEPSPSTPTGDYVQPVNTDRDIQLRTRNLPAPVSLIIHSHAYYLYVSNCFTYLVCSTMDSAITAVWEVLLNLRLSTTMRAHSPVGSLQTR